PQSAGPFGSGACAHSRANRAFDRCEHAGRNRGSDHGRDHRALAPAGGKKCMKFGPVPLHEAEGAIAVHSIRKGDLVLKKGTVIGKAEIAALARTGISEIVVARTEPGDVSEDTAAAEI